MKKILLLLLFCFSFDGIAQNVTFEYDAAGNQIKREYCASCSSRTSNVKEYKDITEEDLQKFHPEDIISYYPNPVKDELYLQWETPNEEKVVAIEIYSFNGQLIRTIKNLNENKAIISFNEFTVGTYLVNLNYATGYQKSITIIKN
jgi:flagellar hook assembly protein FlgD